jgi:hypothetical protein
MGILLPDIIMANIENHMAWYIFIGVQERGHIK